MRLVFRWLVFSGVTLYIKREGKAPKISGRVSRVKKQEKQKRLL